MNGRRVALALSLAALLVLATVVVFRAVQTWWSAIAAPADEHRVKVLDEAHALAVRHGVRTARNDRWDAEIWTNATTFRHSFPAVGLRLKPQGNAPDQPPTGKARLVIALRETRQAVRDVEIAAVFEDCARMTPRDEVDYDGNGGWSARIAFPPPHRCFDVILPDPFHADPRTGGTSFGRGRYELLVELTLVDRSHCSFAPIGLVFGVK